MPLRNSGSWVRWRRIRSTDESATSRLSDASATTPVSRSHGKHRMASGKVACWRSAEPAAPQVGLSFGSAGAQRRAGRSVSH